MLSFAFSTNDPGDENDYGTAERRAGPPVPTLVVPAQFLGPSPEGLITFRDPGDEDDNPAFALA